MREILFRAKCIDNGEWVYGVPIKKALVGSHDGYYPKIIPECDGRHQTIYSTAIKEETLGQYTGLCDKNGTKIFEGDIVHWKKVPYFVRWDSKKAEFVFANDMEADYFVVGFNEHTTMKFCKVVGNIHDNPELLNK